MSFAREVRASRGRVRPVANIKVLEGLACPLCGQQVQESDRAFGCSAWKDGCAFTLWKNALLRVKGPLLNEAIVRLLLTDGQARGSSGTVTLSGGQMSFTPKGADGPALSLPIAYVKKDKPAPVRKTGGKAGSKPKP